MLNFTTIINKLNGFKYNSIDEIIDEFDYKNAFAKAFFTDMKDVYGDLAISLNFMNDEFVKSLITCLRIMNYIKNSDIRYISYSFIKDIKTSLPKVSVLKSTDNGTITVENIPNKNIVKYCYAKKMTQGLISSEGHVNLTQYDENTKDALDIIFNIIENKKECI